MILRPVVLVCAVLLGTAARVSAGWHHPVSTTDGGVGIELASPINGSPPGGFFPCWVTIKNASGSAHTWNFQCTLRGFAESSVQDSSSQTLRVENGATVRAALLLPQLPAAYNINPYWPQTIQIEGYAVEEPTVNVPKDNASYGRSTAFIAMGDTLATPLWEPMKAQLARERAVNLSGSPVEVALLGTDWRALSGFDCLWLTDAEYAGLEGPRRQAIRRWVDQGGTLYLCAEGLAPGLRAGLDLPAAGDEAHPGLGYVKRIPWDGKSLPLSETISLVEAVRQSHFSGPTGDATNWDMVKSLGTIPLNVPFLTGFSVLFAVLVGPVNLFRLAGTNQRHRLFWTTPLISVAASLLLILVIILQDGFGGHGQRVMLTLLLPDQKEAVVVQEQVARTGVLLSRRFSMTEDLILSPLKLGNSTGQSYQQSGRDYGGDWFASRSLQAQRAEAIVPSRAEIQLVNPDAARAGEPPVVSSSIPATLESIRYIDPEGRRWCGGNLHAGERMTLRTDPKARVGEFKGGSGQFYQAVSQAYMQPGNFMAEANDGPFIATLPSIRWEKQRAVFLGPVTAAR